TVSLALSSPLSPYTTLFRSQLAHGVEQVRFEPAGRCALVDGRRVQLAARAFALHVRSHLRVHEHAGPPPVRLGEEREGHQGLSRSEEHTSELQSRVDLVCRL